MTPAGEWWIVSDLHLGLDSPGSPHLPLGDVMAQFLAEVVHRSRSPRRHLVLLGDAFELQGGAPPHRSDPVRRLEALAQHHAGIFGALGDCLHRGVTLDVVSGNHDPALVRADVQREVARLLRVTPSSRVRFHPWLLHVPGVLYAEHGHQHHDLNRVPALLRDGLEHGHMSALHAWTETDGHPVRSRCVHVYQAVRRTQRAEWVARGPAYAALLRREAERQGLPPAAGQALDRVSPFRVATAFARTAGRAVGRRMGVTRTGGYMQHAAARIHQVLVTHGCPVRAYVFGHTHRAESMPIAGGTACYLNSGTWGPDVRGEGPDRRNPLLFPYVHVRAGDGSVECTVNYWDVSAQRTVIEGGKT